MQNSAEGQLYTIRYGMILLYRFNGPNARVSTLYFNQLEVVQNEQPLSFLKTCH